MFEWIKFIGEFFSNLLSAITQVLGLFADGIATINAAFFFSPSFLSPILFLMLTVVIIMWVVNIF